MPTDKEIDAAARAIYDLYWVANKPLWGNAGYKYLLDAEAALTAAEQVRASEPSPSKVFDYIAHGGTEADKQAASMEYLEGMLAGVLKERDELVIENERLRAEQVRASEWQPIETAPKDGAQILVNCTKPYKRCACVRWDGLGWQIAVGLSGRVIECDSEMSHWRPLPSPPVGND